MREMHRYLAAPLLALLLLLAACDRKPTAPALSSEAALPDALSEGIALDRSAPSAERLGRIFSSASREALGNGIAHYSFDVPLGSGQFDVVRIHRVVREQGGRRAAGNGAVFMTTGSALTFEVIYLRPGTTEANRETSVAVYLATNGVDVWGMDFAWTRIPEATSDFTFLRDWGIERDARHTLAAMSIARLLRARGGDGGGPIDLLGYSYGGGVAYAAAGRETREPRRTRNIAGLVIVDMLSKFAPADDASRVNACGDEASFQAMIDAGQYQDPSGATFSAIGALANAAPDETTPIPPFQPLTNRQVALFAGANTFLLAPQPSPFWHFVGASSTDVPPSGLAYTRPARWFTLLAALPPYQPVRTQLDMVRGLCNERDVGFDDNLRRIVVPILYLGAGGGLGTMGEHTITLTGSRDVTRHTVSLQPATLAAIDFGHGDLFLGDDAARLAWAPLKRWLASHGRTDD